MEKQKLVAKVGRKILMPLSIIQTLFFISFISSPFVLIWHSWNLAWKISLTGLLGALLSYLVYKTVKNIIIEIIDEYLKNNVNKSEHPRKSKFQERILEMQENSKN